MSALPPEARAIIDAVIEALELPYAAAEGGERVREAIIQQRAMHLLVTLHAMVDDSRPTKLEWDLDYLRRRLAEHPPAGYVTQAQARERLAAGANWSEAVTLNEGEGGR